MNENKLSKLQELVHQRQAIRVTPRHRPDEKLYGVPLAVTDELLLLHEIREFHLDGYLVLPLHNIRGVRLRDSEETMQRILTAEGALKPLGLSEPVVLTNLFDMFASLQASNIFVSVEACEPRGKFVEDFFVLGRVADVASKRVSILPFDATGRWEESPTALPYKRILSVTFLNEYMNVFSKYAHD